MLIIEIIIRLSELIFSFCDNKNKKNSAERIVSDEQFLKTVNNIGINHHNVTDFIN